MQRRLEARQLAAGLLQLEPGQVHAQLDKLAPETEDVFDDAFWEGLHGVCNALDNVQARLYVDQRCVYYQKSLLESGISEEQIVLWAIDLSDAYRKLAVQRMELWLQGFVWSDGCRADSEHRLVVRIPSSVHRRGGSNTSLTCP